jgi:hypothetical protein
VSCSLLLGGFETTWVSIVKEPLASNEVLMVVINGGFVRCFTPLGSVMGRTAGVESVKTDCVVTVVVHTEPLPLTTVTIMADT